MRWSSCPPDARPERNRGGVAAYEARVLDIHYVTLAEVCKNIDRWLASSLPRLGIEKYLYRIV